MARKMLRMPRRGHIGVEKAFRLITCFAEYPRAVIDLYDSTIRGPHDRLLPIDILATNALNAYGRALPMTHMQRLWDARKEVLENQVSEVTRCELVDLSSKQLDEQIRLVASVLDSMGSIKGWKGGGTRATKLLHRLRPNIVPIVDSVVGEKHYPIEYEYQEWNPILKRIMRDVRGNAPELYRLSEQLKIYYHTKVSLLRTWDILLWSASMAGD